MYNNSISLDQRFKKLFQDGKLVQVHVSQWGMSYALSGTDLKLEKGLKTSEAIPGFASLGKKKLMPDEVRLKFKRLEANARSFLNQNSHKFPVADAHFVPQRKLPEVIVQLNKLKVAFELATTEFIRDYGVNKQKMLDLYPAHVASLEPCYPSAAMVASKFSFSISVYEVAVPSELKEVNLVGIQAENLAIDEMKKTYQAQMQTQFQESTAAMENFVKEATVALRGRVVETFQLIANKIANREVVTQTNIKSLRSIIEEFDELDFFDDDEVKAKLAEVKQMVNSGSDYRNNADAITKLQEVVGSVLATAGKMSDVDAITGQYFRKLDL